MIFLKQIFGKPFVALFVVGGLCWAGLSIGRGHILVDSCFAASRDNALWPRVLFFALCLGTLICARRWAASRDPVHLLVGLAWSAYACGGWYVVGLFAISLLIHFGLKDRNPYLAVFITAGLLILLFGWALPSINVPSPANELALQFSRGWMACRLLVYSFELQSIRESDHSLLRFLTYGPFNIFCWPGEPPMLSYVTYFTPRAREKLDQLGTAQLYRSGFKLLSLSLLLRSISTLMPQAYDFTRQPIGIQLTLLMLFYGIVFLRISAVADMATGLSNLAGLYAPSTFAFPLWASTPYDHWRRWNVHLVSFLKISCMYPVLRWRRSFLLLLPPAIAGSIIIHIFFDCIGEGRGVFSHLSDIVAFRLLGASWLIVLLIIATPIEKKKLRLGFVGIVVTQLLLATSLFPAAIAIVYPKQRLGVGAGRCYLRSIVDRSRVCAPPAK